MGIMSFGDNPEVIIEGIGRWMMMIMMITGQIQGIGIIGILVLDGTMMIMNLEGVIGRITKNQVPEDTNAITDKPTTLNSRTTPDPDRTDTKATEMTKIKKCPLFYITYTTKFMLYLETKLIIVFVRLLKVM